MAWCAFFQGEFTESEEHLRLAVDGVPDVVQATRPPSPWQFPNDAVAFMHVQYGLALWQRGDLDGFHQQLRRARRRTERLPRPHGPFNLAYALTYQAWVLSEVGEFEAADSHRRAARDRRAVRVRLLDAGRHHGRCHRAGGRASLASDAPDSTLLLEQAERLAGTSMLSQMIDSQLLLPYGLTAQAELLDAAGDHDQALALCDQALTVADADRQPVLRVRDAAPASPGPSGPRATARGGGPPSRGRAGRGPGLDPVRAARPPRPGRRRGASGTARRAAGPSVVRGGGRREVLGPVVSHHVSAGRRRIAILGGGMAGVTAAWRLSEPGWQSHFESITIYQRGGRLGGKGASHRGDHQRVEEHGLHIWLGYYDNAFRLLRECYDELDRTRTDPRSPIATVEDALKPATRVGLEDFDGEHWHHWLGDFAANDLRPGADTVSAASFTGADIVRRALRLLGDFSQSIRRESPSPTISMTTSSVPPTVADSAGTLLGTTALGAAIEALGLAIAALASIGSTAGPTGLDPAVALVDAALREIRSSVLRSLADDPEAVRTWHLISVVLAQVRGIIAEGLLEDPAGFTRLNEEDYRDWIVRHGADPVVADSTLISGLYDLVFGFADADPQRPGFGAGLGVFLSGKIFFDYKGSIFWKMKAGMGDVVFAPLHQALRARGVGIEFFHRVDELHLDESRQHVDRVTLGRQVALAPDRDQYDPLIRVKDLPCFPARVDTSQLAGAVGDRSARPRVVLVHVARCRPGRAAPRDRLRRRGVRHPAGHGPTRLRPADGGPSRVAGHGRRPRHRRHPGPAAVAPRRRADPGVGGAGIDDERLRRAVRHVGVDAPAPRGRGLERPRPTRHDRLLLQHVGHAGSSRPPRPGSAGQG